MRDEALLIASGADLGTPSEVIRRPERRGRVPRYSAIPAGPKPQGLRDAAVTTRATMVTQRGDALLDVHSDTMVAERRVQVYGSACLYLNVAVDSIVCPL